MLTAKIMRRKEKIRGVQSTLLQGIRRPFSFSLQKHSMAFYAKFHYNTRSRYTGSKIRDFYSSYVNGLEQTNNRVECHIFKAVFKKLITRLAAVSKELRATENMVSRLK